MRIFSSSATIALVKAPRKKNPLAVALGELRWKGVSKAERSVIMTKAITARWAKRAKMG